MVICLTRRDGVWLHPTGTSDASKASAASKGCSLSRSTLDGNVLENKMNIDRIKKKVVHFYIMAAMLLIFGTLGICLGIWVQFFRNSTPGELFINRTLILYSIGLIVSGLIHFSSFRTIRRLINIMNNKGTI
jgi:hypothetical protein